MDERCGKCRFYNNMSNPQDNNQFGYCRRFPPTVHGHEGYGQYLKVGSHGWCGEFQFNEGVIQEKQQ